MAIYTIHKQKSLEVNTAIELLAAAKKNSIGHVAMATESFLNNANGPSDHHTKFEVFLIYC